MINNPNIEIQKIAFESEQLLTLHFNSLQKEFGYLLGLNAPEKDLKAKKRQVETVVFLVSYLGRILKLVDEAFIKQEKTEMCLMNFGVSYYEFKRFMQDTLVVMDEKAEMNKSENGISVEIPMAFAKFFNHESKVPENIEVKYADKPSIPFESLKNAASNSPGYLKSAIMSLESKMKIINDGKSNKNT